MKNLSIISFAALALAAGSAHAGGAGGCVYGGDHSPIVSAEADGVLENSAGDQTTDPKLLLGLLQEEVAEENEAGEILSN